MLSSTRRGLLGQTQRALGRQTCPACSANTAAFRRLASSLAVLEQRDGVLNHGSLSAITAAKKLGGPIHVFVAGGNIKSVAEEAAKVDGVEKVIAVDSAAYEKVSGQQTYRLVVFPEY